MPGGRNLMQTLSKQLEAVPFMRAKEPEFLVNIVNKLPPDPKILEIGTFRGLSAVVMAKARPDVEITTIDPHIGIHDAPMLYSNPFIVETNLKKYGVYDRVKHISLSSRDFSPKDEYDLLFIDGDHSYSGVSLDYHKFELFVKKGGYIVFHDFGDHKGVTKFVTELHKENAIIFRTLFIFKK